MPNPIPVLAGVPIYASSLTTSSKRRLPRRHPPCYLSRPNHLGRDSSTTKGTRTWFKAILICKGIWIARPLKSYSPLTQTSLSFLSVSKMWTKSSKFHNGPQPSQSKYQIGESPDPGRKEKPSLKACNAFTILLQIIEPSLLWVMVQTELSPIYLWVKTCTHSLWLSCNKLQSNLPRATLEIRASLCPKPPKHRTSVPVHQMPTTITTILRPNEVSCGGIYSIRHASRQVMDLHGIHWNGWSHWFC